jgi:hypothetical protein
MKTFLYSIKFMDYYKLRGCHLMAKKQEDNGLLSKIGPWSFILGLIIAFVSAISGSVFWMLGALGLVVGLLNITDKELHLYLLASLTFLVSVDVLAATIGDVVDIVPFVSQWLNFIKPLLANVAIFVAPGAGVVALKALYNISRD